MPYPTTWWAGDVIGRNLVSTPKPLGGGDETGNWTQGDVFGTSPDRYLGMFTVTSVELPAEIVGGQTYDLWIRARALSDGMVSLSTTVDVAGTGTSAVTVPTNAEFTDHALQVVAPAGEGPFYLVLTGAINEFRVASVRLDDTGSPVTGYADGDSSDPLYTAAWEGLPRLSVSVFGAQADSDPPPDGGETPGGDDLPGQRVADFLGRGDDLTVVALAGEAQPVVSAMARAYTRGQGFTDDGIPSDDIAAVITTATARMVTNPGQVPYDVGNVSVRGGFSGWTLAELFVLNRYRKRAS